MSTYIKTILASCLALASTSLSAQNVIEQRGPAADASGEHHYVGTLDVKKHNPLLKPYFKLTAAYNVQTAADRDHGHMSGTCGPVYNLGVGTDIYMNRYVKGLGLQLEASYIAIYDYTNNACCDAKFEKDMHLYGQSALRLAAGLQYVIPYGDWPVKPLLRGGISRSFLNTGNEPNKTYAYAGVGCWMKIQRRAVALHADWWSNANCKYFLTLDVLF